MCWYTYPGEAVLLKGTPLPREWMFMTLWATFGFESQWLLPEGVLYIWGEYFPTLRKSRMILEDPSKILAKDSLSQPRKSPTRRARGLRIKRGDGYNSLRILPYFPLFVYSLIRTPKYTPWCRVTSTTAWYKSIVFFRSLRKKSEPHLCFQLLIALLREMEEQANSGGWDRYILQLLTVYRPLKVLYMEQLLNQLIVGVWNRHY